ncbi:TetR/AcrR family transcriptional regulator [Clostridium oryzae]|uniref:TetR/AcrR family transcriptional regulator n=1 Tax=Clostridium oryzae TaxID=1450648 RepID=UPI003BFA6D00
MKSFGKYKFRHTYAFSVRENGIKKMTIDNIAKKADIGKGTFYHFFKSKEDFVYEVIMFNKKKIISYANKIIEEKGGIDKDSFLNLLSKFSFTSKLYYFKRHKNHGNSRSSQYIEKSIKAGI